MSTLTPTLATIATMSADDAFVAPWSLDTTPVVVTWDHIRPLIDDYPPETQRTVQAKVASVGYVNALTHYLSSFHSVDQRLAGRLQLAEMYLEAPANLTTYLLAMRSLMQRYERALAATVVTIDLTAADAGLKLHQLYTDFNTLRKTGTPNIIWRYLWDHRAELEPHLDNTMDRYGDHHSLSVFRRTYLNRNKFDGQLIELPQYTFLRIAAQLWAEPGVPASLDKLLHCYTALRLGHFVPPSPTIFNAGMTFPQMASCFLQIIYDNMDSILDSYKTTGIISKENGASGISLTQLRSGTAIGNGGLSEGVKPPVEVLDRITGQVHQGRTKRPGATQLTLDVFHIDTQDLIKMCAKNSVGGGAVEHCHITLGTHYLLYERANHNASWSFFCPSDVPKLYQTHGRTWEHWYKMYERQGLARKTMKARELIKEYTAMRLKTGMPFVVNLDAINGKTNQSNIGDGMIHSLNLCQEVALKADNKRVPSCILSSTRLQAFVITLDDGTKAYDWLKCGATVRLEVRNLNQLIARNFTPLPAIAFSAAESAPIGIGAQGFADVLAEFDLAFNSAEATHLTAKLASCIYYNALLESMTIAKERGYSYPAFPGSPFSQGRLQFDMWVEEAKDRGFPVPVIIEPSQWGQDGSYTQLRQDIMTYGIANSQLTTAQPTAGTAQIWRSNEAWEPFYRIIYSRKVLSGEYIALNEYVERDMNAIGLWNEETLDYIREKEGSIKDIAGYYQSRVSPEIYQRLIHLEAKYQTAFEVPQRSLLDHAIARGPYMDGSQSTSLYFDAPQMHKVMAAENYAVEHGLKTICYYTRCTAVQNAVDMTRTIPLKVLEIQETSSTKYEMEKLCLRNDPECTSCA